jgi:hypothetical protein
VIERGRAGQHRDALGLDEVDHRVGVEHGYGQDRGAADERRDASRLVAEGVEERVDREISIALA